MGTNEDSLLEEAKKHEREIQYFKNLREEIKKNIDNWDKILEIIQPYPLVLQNEIKVVKYLQKNPRDFAGALKQLPEQIQLWVFAYGSLLFNRKISEAEVKLESTGKHLGLSVKFIKGVVHPPPFERPAAW